MSLTNIQKNVYSFSAVKIKAKLSLLQEKCFEQNWEPTINRVKNTLAAFQPVRQNLFSPQKCMLHGSIHTYIRYTSIQPLWRQAEKLSIEFPVLIK